ncbi:hypothetical protein P4475_18815 [Halalkalibacterium halodurans]|uniref:hypothetical protein n=1 Tax=Halalkalibacterium halodurans TaxID=86665 RepID=UPI0010680CBE|nr:hypothetical protein [Halalkalibacterium halodurans]MED3648822.1 hypothetical protein [Halalkalibacterium halodurans]TES47101.1 hypothetical protein E2L07_19430 [Halalkalibacterium halodurans]
MPAISKIRLTNVVYEEGNKRYNDELFLFDGHNGAILLENGGGKTVLIQTALQAIIPHTNLAERQLRNTLLLENAPAHIAIEWIINEKPRRYVVTAVTLFMTKHGLDSLRYVYEYEANDPNGIDEIPFVRGTETKRTAERGEMQDYYSQMRERSFLARTFQTIKEYRSFLEEQYHIIANEWESVVKINSSEGGVEAFFDDCKNTNQLFDRLLIPTVEQSIAGHDEKMFADMFEKQHTSFKQYKKLKETIEENKRIQEELETFVQAFEQLHQKKLEYKKTKQKAKGTWEEIQLQKEKIKGEQTVLFEKLEEWKQKDYKHAIKSASYEIAVEKSTLDSLTKEYNQAFAKYAQLEEELKRHHLDYYSLKLAELKAEQKNFKDQLKHFEEEMDKLNQTEELEELEEQLEQAKRSLLGFFIGKIEKIEKEIRGLTFEMNPIKEQLQQSQDTLTSLQEKEAEQEKKLSSIKSLLDTRTKDMNQLEQQLLANPKQQRVQEEIVNWNNRYQFLDDEMIRLQQEEKQIEIEKSEAQKRKDAFQEERVNRERERDSIEYQLDTINKEQKNLIAILSAVRPQWAALENVYENESSIASRLVETIERFEKERSHLLYLERIAHRFVDDYDKQNVFFGDSFVESQLKSWKNQFDLLLTGVEYIQSLDAADYLEKKSYPLWSLTLITTNKSKAMLQEKLNGVADRLQFPIHVMTTEEAAVAHKDESPHTWIAPLHWSKGMEAESFQHWKEDIAKTANETILSREQKEKEMKKWEHAQKAFDDFMAQFSYEKMTKLQEERSTIIRQIERLSLSIVKEDEQMEDLRSKLTLLKDTVKKDQDEMKGLEWKVERGNLYLQYSREVEEAKKKEKQVKEELVELEKEVVNVKLQYDALFEQKAELDKRIGSLNTELSILKRDEQFIAVQPLTPLFSGEGKQMIQEKIRNLEFKIRAIQVSYGEWNAKLENAKAGIERTSKAMDELRTEHGQLDEDVLFPSDGMQLLKDLWEKIEKTENQVDSLNQEVKQKSSAKEKQEGKWEAKVEQFREKYPDDSIFEFTTALAEVKEELKSAALTLKESKSYLEQEKNRMRQELASIEGAERGLERFIEKHHFNAPDIEAISLNSEESRTFTYQRKPFVDAIIRELEQVKEALQGENEKVEREKQSFREFSQTISDIKMRQMAENGIEYKRTYEDLIDFKKNMLISVERATNYANEYIRQKDTELQAFINQIHAHLKTLVEELKQIPKKTRVKVENDWKQIFTFAIPEWEEEDGKNRIRDYIEWILEQLESERFLNDQGMQDDGKVRKEIDMWLQSKQLLRWVMKNEEMKVNCRKVTNDNKVTTRSYSWEQSNVWSGGEKWSKNMTLFLGIQNYIAEKKQHIQPNMKRHRAVILDNPFGKASSDHVLSPVFFVAEQLGFQIIALTAHAEGKFLQDFFPVIYSCRLRESVDSSKKVMTKEKWLHHAYFQDHEPKSMDRLGESEQMVLFEFE